MDEIKHTNENKPAYPQHWQSLLAFEDQIHESGLTKREMFAKDAPPMPDWFECQTKLTAPSQPKSWVEMEDGEDKELLKNWQHDPCFDLPDHLEWYQMAWEDYREKKWEYDQAKKIEKFIAWRLYFADELLKQLES